MSVIDVGLFVNQNYMDLPIGISLILAGYKNAEKMAQLTDEAEMQKAINQIEDIFPVLTSNFSGNVLASKFLSDYDAELPNKVVLNAGAMSFTRSGKFKLTASEKKDITKFAAYCAKLKENQLAKLGIETTINKYFEKFFLNMPAVVVTIMDNGDAFVQCPICPTVLKLSQANNGLLSSGNLYPHCYSKHKERINPSAHDEEEGIPTDPNEKPTKPKNPVAPKGNFRSRRRDVVTDIK